MNTTKIINKYASEYYRQVYGPEDYLYSSARNYHGQDGILKVTIVR